ncbi:IclR family transcriptional regulator [Catenuloplanes indicus]|uniref:Glycerol operon regulatory protein n=1 Tax=Catenuloplanes indicus TaxID=137267 RepID=A0AAE4AXH2_9ACTN|nr:IclR family transcriptional regulator [Catenuloplanes indicus]MDQ0365731.1 DNA-binding IclR family transcriptional regulator [Catenuloplanes indicus]
MSNSGPALVQSVDRAVTVLEILARRGEAGVTEIAGELGVHKSTAFRLVGALEQRGLVDQLSDRGKYRLGLGMVRLAGAAAARLDLTVSSRAACEKLADHLGETVNVAVLTDGYAINISQVRGRAAVSSYNWVGQRTPAHATSSGKVLLAFQPPEARDRALATPLERFTPYTLTTAAELASALADIRRTGWAATAEELELGLNAVAAPVRDHEGTVVAAISTSGPSYRLTTADFPSIASHVLTTAREISTRLGHLG